MVGKHITSACIGETRIPSDMCVGKHGSLGICVRENAILGETHITVTPVFSPKSGEVGTDVLHSTNWTSARIVKS